MAKQTAVDVRAALQQRYGPPESVIFFEVANSTGFAANRWADAVAMGCWPSRGLHVQGFEIKVSKYDWRKEKAHPRKAEGVARYCDFWWLVTIEGVVADVSELPPAWGWLLLTPEGKLITKKQAEKLEPTPLDRTFVASLLRSAGKIDQATIDVAVQAAVAQRMAGYEERREREIQNRVKAATANSERITKRYELAERILGEEALPYLGDAEFLAAVRLVLSLGVTRTYTGLNQLREELKRAVERFDAAAVDLQVPAQGELLDLSEKTLALRKSA